MDNVSPTHRQIQFFVFLSTFDLICHIRAIFPNMTLVSTLLALLCTWRREVFTKKGD